MYNKTLMLSLINQTYDVWYEDILISYFYILKIQSNFQISNIQNNYET